MLPAPGSQRQAKPELLRTTHDRLRDDAVQADRRQQRRERSEKPRQPGHQTLLDQEFVYLRFQSLHRMHVGVAFERFGFPHRDANTRNQVNMTLLASLKPEDAGHDARANATGFNVRRLMDTIAASFPTPRQVRW